MDFGFTWEGSWIFRGVFHDYFSHCGFEEVLFPAKTDHENEIQRKFSEVDTIYLPAGDTEVLYRELKQRVLQNRLLEFSVCDNRKFCRGNYTCKERMGPLEILHRFRSSWFLCFHSLQAQYRSRCRNERRYKCQCPWKYVGHGNMRKIAYYGNAFLYLCVKNYGQRWLQRDDCIMKDIFPLLEA